MVSILRSQGVARLFKEQLQETAGRRLQLLRPLAALRRRFWSLPRHTGGAEDGADAQS